MTAGATPEIVERAEQPYVAIRTNVTMRSIGPAQEQLFPEIFGWLGARGIDPAGAPFVKYNLIDMERELEIEIAVPVASAVEGDDRVLAGTLPAGKYAVATHVGHPQTLVGATKALLDWASEQGVRWDQDGDRWVARLEFSNTDPNEQPDLNKWETDLVFRVAQ